MLVREKQDHLKRKDNFSLESQRDRNRKGTIGFRNVSVLSFLGIIPLANVVVNKRKWAICVSNLAILSLSSKGGEAYRGGR